jgi:hypothetical protein
VTVVMMDFDVMVVMACSLAVSGDGLTNGCASAVEVGPQIALAIESTNREGRRFKRRISFNTPIFTAEHFGIWIKFVDETKTKMTVWFYLTRDVNATPTCFP